MEEALHHSQPSRDPQAARLHQVSSIMVTLQPTRFTGSGYRCIIVEESLEDVAAQGQSSKAPDDTVTPKGKHSV